MSESPPTSTISFDYIKSNQFRCARADGVWGGLNGHLDVVMSFFSERPAIPQHVVHALHGNTLGEEIPDQRVGRNSIIREVEVCISMNLTVAKVFRDWLDSKIKSIEEIKGAEPEQVK
jgi:hypothetical protein